MEKSGITMGFIQFESYFGNIQAANIYFSLSTIAQGFVTIQSKIQQHSLGPEFQTFLISLPTFIICYWIVNQWNISIKIETRQEFFINIFYAIVTGLVRIWNYHAVQHMSLLVLFLVSMCGPIFTIICDYVMNRQPMRRNDWVAIAGISVGIVLVAIGGNSKDSKKAEMSIFWISVRILNTFLTVFLTIITKKLKKINSISINLYCNFSITIIAAFYALAQDSVRQVCIIILNQYYQSIAFNDYFIVIFFVGTLACSSTLTRVRSNQIGHPIQLYLIGTTWQILIGFLFDYFQSGILPSWITTIGAVIMTAFVIWNLGQEEPVRRSQVNFDMIVRPIRKRMYSFKKEKNKQNLMESHSHANLEFKFSITNLMSLKKVPTTPKI